LPHGEANQITEKGTLRGGKSWWTYDKNLIKAIKIMETQAAVKSNATVD
jgi:hypothetical protein